MVNLYKEALLKTTDSILEIINRFFEIQYTHDPSNLYVSSEEQRISSHGAKYIRSIYLFNFFIFLKRYFLMQLMILCRIFNYLSSKI